jgi:hypothetical protein
MAFCIQPESVSDLEAKAKLFDTKKLIFSFNKRARKSSELYWVETQLRTIPVSEGEVNIFSPKASVRKTSTNEKKMLLEMITVSLGKEEKKIYDVKTMYHLRMQPELLMKHQKFGYVQKDCKIDSACIKCIEGQWTKDCNRVKNQPTACANCAKHWKSFLHSKKLNLSSSGPNR